MQYEGLQQDKYQNSFQGFDRRWLRGDGTISGMVNICGLAWPHLSSRPQRSKLAELTAPQGMTVHDGTPIWVDGGKLYWNGVEVEGLTLDPDTDKELVVMGRRLLIWPDKKYYNFDPDRTEPAYGSLEAEAAHLQSLYIFNDLYAGEAAECNAVRCGRDVSSLFKVGDAVHLKGCWRHPDNSETDGADRYLVIREISEDGRTLRFYPYNLTLNVGATVDEDGKLYIGGKKTTPSSGGTYWFIDPADEKCYRFTMPSLSAGNQLRWKGGSMRQFSYAADADTGLETGISVTELTEPGKAEKEVRLTEYLPYYENARLTGPLAAGDYYFRWSSGGYKFTLSSALADGEYMVWVYNSTYGQILVDADLSAASRISLTSWTTVPSGYTEVQMGGLSIERRVPEIEHPFVHNNRLWGTSGNYIRSSALGDPKNWYKYDANISTGSWELEYMSEGGFTGGISYLGYPVFFKHREIIKIMGYKPSNYETSVTQHCIGTDEGKSLAVAGGTLFYYGINGFQAYQGSFPISLHAPFAGARFSQVVAGSDGDRYYANAQDENGAWHLFVYDVPARGWYEEDGLDCLSIARGTGIWLLDNDGNVWNYDGQGIAEGDFDWLIEWGEMDGSTLDKKLLNEISIRLRLAAGARATVYAAYDDGADWMKVQELTGDGVRTQAALFSPRRCDRMRMLLRGRGQMELAGVTLRYSDSSWGRLERKRYGQL